MTVFIVDLLINNHNTGYCESVNRAVWCYCRLLTLRNEVVNVTNQWAGLCFYSYINFVYYTARPH